jgi:hypothetical protein
MTVTSRTSLLLELINFYYLFFHRRPIERDDSGKIRNKNKLI